MEKVVFSTKTAGVIGYPDAEIRILIHTLHNMQKLTQMDHRLKG